MKKFLNLALIFIVTLLLEGVVFSDSIPNNDNPVTFLGPTIKGRFTNRLVEDKAYSLLGEAGFRNIRIGGTYGWKLTECQRFKISAEYLWQNINYAFYSGNSRTWVNQIAGGINYQWDLALNAMRPQLDISAYMSHAPSHALGNVTWNGFDDTGLPVIFNNERRVAGANAQGVIPGFAISPWVGSRLKAILNYDNVDYNTKYNVVDNDTSGFGGTLEYNQLITDCLALGLTGSIRKPFNYYDVNLNFAVPYFGAWTIGVFGSYTDGKHTLPDTYNLGITADYYLDQSRDETACFRRTGIPVTSNMLAYVSTPAVYMPQVLAIPDNLTTSSCNIAPVIYLGTPNADPGLPFTTDPFTFSFAPLFAGANIVYSIAVTINGTNGSPSDFSINPNTGLLSYNGPGDGGDYNLTITGSNACGSASVSFNYDNLD